MKSIDEMCEVMQASKTKEIQHKYIGVVVPGIDPENQTWNDSTPPHARPRWNWDMYDYRVKPPDQFHITFVRGSDGKLYGPPVLERPGDDSVIEFIELTPEVKAKLGLT